MIAHDRRRSQSIANDRLRLYVNSYAIVCNQVQSRSQAIAGIEPCFIHAIGCNRLRSSVIICEQSSAIMRLECVQYCYASGMIPWQPVVYQLLKVRVFWLDGRGKLTRNTLWKKSENKIVYSIALAKNSLFLKTFCTKKRRFFLDLAAILGVSKDNRSRMLTPIKSWASFVFMLVDWSYNLLPLNGKPWNQLSQMAAIICEHAIRDLRLSGFSDRAIPCDRLRSFTIICEPGFTKLP